MNETATPFQRAFYPQLAEIPACKKAQPRERRRGKGGLMFVRKRFSSNHRFHGSIYSYQLLEAYREGGKVKQRLICNLGYYDNVEDALEGAKHELEDYRRTLACGRPLFDWPKTRQWRMLGPEGQEREKAKWRELIASRVAFYETRVALLQSVVARKANVH